MISNSHHPPSLKCSLVPRHGGGGGERAPGTHCLLMRLVATEFCSMPSGNKLNPSLFFTTFPLPHTNKQSCTSFHLTYSEMIYHHGMSLNKHQTPNFHDTQQGLPTVTWANNPNLMGHKKIQCKSLPEINVARYHKCQQITATSPAGAATVDTHAWTKLYTEIMSWISSVYEAASNQMVQNHPLKT